MEGSRLAEDRLKEMTMWYSAVRCIVTCILSLLAVPLATTAQPRGNIPLIGVLEPNPEISPRSCWAAFQQGLHDLGYVEGQHLTFAYRYAANHFDRLPALAADLVRLTPAVLWTHSNAAALAAKQATTTIPIVVGVANELVTLGLVESLARPGGNLTGLDLRRNDLMGKRLELLKDAVPTISRMAVLVDPMNPLYAGVPQNIAPEAQALRVHLQRVEARQLEAFAGAFAAMVQGGADALMLPEGPPFGVGERQRLLELALQHRLPTICSHGGWGQDGCLLTYGASVDDLCARSAVLMDKILKGAKPADLPVERPSKFELIINLKTAQALGLTMPPALLLQADRVIQ
jgi:putative ABC transport system substrate-binding protein